MGTSGPFDGKNRVWKESWNISYVVEQEEWEDNEKENDINFRGCRHHFSVNAVANTLALPSSTLDKDGVR